MQTKQGKQHTDIQNHLSQNNQLLALREIVRFFPPNRRILNRISLSIEEGETIRILGRTGSGKTLLADILMGICLPDSGEVYFHGRSFRTMTEEERRTLRLQEYTVLSRDAGFFPSLSMVENVSLPLTLTGETGRNVRRKAMDAMEKMGVAQVSARKPYQLSEFEQKKLQLARAELIPSHILVADSFTAGLMQAEEATIWRQLKQMQDERKGTLIHLTDEIGGAGNVDRTWRLADGYLWEEEMIREEHLQKNYWQE